MDNEIISEIATDLFDELHYILKTRLPYPWDFIHMDLKPASRLFINNTSYFVVYFAFIIWFVKYVMTNMNELSGGRLRPKPRYLVLITSLAMVTQMVWPVFITATHFFTCSYYPWFTAAIVCYLYVSVPLWSLLYQATDSSADFILTTLLEIGLEAMDSSSGSSSGSSDSSFHPAEELSERLLTTSSELDGQHNTVDLRQDKGFFTRFKTQKGATKSYGFKVKKSYSGDALSRRDPDTSFEKGSSSPDKSLLGKSVDVLRNKKGICGRCWKKDDLPFKPGFSSLRSPYTTRSGLEYGPQHHFLNNSEFIEEFGL